MTKGLHVPSEIGKLRKVCLHRPGDELLNLPPDELERLLFDDVPFLEVAQQEHDTFAQILRDQGVEVLYLENLVARCSTRSPAPAPSSPTSTSPRPASAASTCRRSSARSWTPSRTTSSSSRRPWPA